MLIGISGKQGSGKDTLANYIKNNYNYYKYNLADPLYRIAYILYPSSCLKAYFDNRGIWSDGELENQKRLFKEIELNDNYYGRNLLQDLGDSARKSDQFIFCKLAAEVARFHTNLIIPDIRTKYELEWLQSRKGILIYVERNVKQEDTHETESYQDLLYRKSDYVLDNTGTLSEFNIEIKLLVEEILCS